MSRVITPQEIRAELGLTEPPFRLNAFRQYLGVRFILESGVRSGGAAIWRPDGVTVSLPRGSRERNREDGSHELGHVANGDLGPHRPVLYRRGSGRGAALNLQVEDRATEWGMDALIGAGALGIAVNHEQIRSRDDLARKFLVTPRFLTMAASRYGLSELVLDDPSRYARYVDSDAWGRRSNEVLAARPVCERRLCGHAAVVVGHLRFDRMGHERPEDVEALCRSCYEEITLGAEVATPQLDLF
jgi:hypothetical protein